MPRLRDFPLMVILWLGVTALATIPIVYAVMNREWEAARVFLYHALFFWLLGLIVGVAASGVQIRLVMRYNLVTLLGFYALFPALLGLPLVALVPTLGYGGGYFEALSALTTTGATMITDPETVPGAVHLWRAVLAWYGGFVILLAAVAILEPMNLGGFEIAATVSGQRQPMQRGRRGAGQMRDRLIHHARAIAPPYIGATAILVLILISLGQSPLISVSHAMSVLSTSGISPVGGLAEAGGGVLAEVAFAVVLILAVTHRGFGFLRLQGTLRGMATETEVRFAVFVLTVVTSLLFLRHFVAAVEVDQQSDFFLLLQALWGTFFTVFSFLTTLGMESADWQTAREWTGQATPGIILLGLAMIGGGAATTAGGVKLLRIFALYKHSLREIDRLVVPRSVGGAGITARRIRREGAYIAWIFLMLFLISIGVLLLALGLAGQRFDESIALSIAALTNTGPAAQQLLPDLAYAGLNGWARSALCLAMVVGRLEVLVVVALFNPDYWRQV